MVRIHPDPPAAPGGAIAQLGERYNGIVEVTGSIPVGSTSSLQSASLNAGVQRCFLFRLLFNNPEEVKRIRFHTWNRIYWV